MAHEQYFKGENLYIGSCNFGLLCGLSFLLILASCFNLSGNIGCIMLFLVWSRGLLLWCTPGALSSCLQLGGVWSLGR